MKFGIYSVVLILSVFIAFPTQATNCQGCCSWHGGVICDNGVTRCADGTPLSSTCQSKGCDDCESYSDTPSPDTPSPDTPAPDTPSPLSSDTIKIANFNIQIFGTTKAGKAEVMQILADIISTFDIVAIQEIRDLSGSAIESLEAKVDSLGVDYEYIIGPRLGRTSSKEQYAYMYRTGTISVGSSYTYDDTGEDLFHREPFIVQFSAKNGTFDFVLITIHTDPDEATEEINALPDVVTDAQAKFPGESEFIILGDLNADCSYFDEDDTGCPLRASEYTWLITNDMDTNLAASECTYDRIIMTLGANDYYASECGVYRFDEEYSLTEEQAKAVSDHYPVWSTFSIGQNTGNEDGNEAGGDEGSGGGCFIGTRSISLGL